MGQRIVLAIEAEQSGYVDDPLIHLALLSLPWHVLQQILEERVCATHPAGQQIHPCTAAQRLTADHSAQWSER